MTHEQYQSCLDACVRCALACEHCATACLAEPDTGAMAKCIRLNQDCAAICWLAASFMGRRSEFDTEVCRLCASICDACAAECGAHAPEHCQRCAEACRTCVEACRTMAVLV